MSFFLLNLAYAGKLVVVVIAGNRSSVCVHPNNIRWLVALDLFNHEYIV